MNWMLSPGSPALGCWLKIAGALQAPQVPAVLVRCDTHSYFSVEVGPRGDEVHPEGELPDGVAGAALVSVRL